MDLIKGKKKLYGRVNRANSLFSQSLGEEKAKILSQVYFFFPAPSLVWNWTEILVQCCGLRQGKEDTHSLGHLGTLEGLPLPIFMAIQSEDDRCRRFPALVRKDRAIGLNFSVLI